jgi:hypothetical protein
MASALSGNADAAVYSRFTPPGGVRAIDLPFTGTARARAFQLVRLRDLRA